MLKQYLSLFVFGALTCATVFAEPGYFKDFFNDGGYGIVPRNPTAENIKTLLHFTVEPHMTNSTAIDKAHICGTPIDSNGVLLYPDNSPRFRVYYHGGGQFSHLFDACGVTGQDRLRTFVRNGGSWVGSCAGAGAASLAAKPGGLSQVGVWPHYYQDTGDHYSAILDTRDTGFAIIRYFQAFRGFYDTTVTIPYSSGGYFPDDYDPPYSFTEFISVYQTPGYSSTGKYGLISYKDTTKPWEGRVVITGGHPEGGASTHEQGMLFAAMVKYAAEGNGKPRLKGILKYGEPRVMNDNNKIGFEKIGDLQYHHFAVQVPEQGDSLRINLDGEEGYLFHLYLKKDDFAFSGPGVVCDTQLSSDKTILLTRADGLTEGTWYVGVECATEIIDTQYQTAYVDANGKETYDVYTGQTGVLNGVGYTLTAAIHGVDATPPSAPSNVTGTADSARLRVCLSWNPAADGESGISSYKIYRNGLLAGVSEKAMFEDCDSLIPSDKYVYTVAAINGFDLVGPQSLPCTVSVSGTVIIDNRDPGTSFTGIWSETRDSLPLNGWCMYSKRNGATYTWETPVKTGVSCEIRMCWTATPSRFSAVPVKIYDGTTEVFSGLLNQSVNGNQWNLLASHTFMSAKGKVVITSTRTDSTTGADAVRFQFDGATSASETPAMSESGMGPMAIRLNPNPFNPAVALRIINIPRGIHPADLKVHIYNMNGQQVVTLPVSAIKTSGQVTLLWDASARPSGMYFFKISTGTKTCSTSGLLLK